jgi:hypothetical protein
MNPVSVKVKIVFSIPAIENEPIGRKGQGLFYELAIEPDTGFIAFDSRAGISQFFD